MNSPYHPALVGGHVYGWACVICASFLLVLSSCTPSLYPLYRDYEDERQQNATLQRIEHALIDAGWTIVPSPANNVIATDQRQVRQWGLYSVMVSLEAVDIGGDHVRLLVHPYREYIWGTRSKIPFLNPAIRRSIMRDLDNAMADQSLTAVGTGMSRDRERTR